MIQIQDISKSYGERYLIQNGSFVVNKGEKIGLVGRNGSGKSTLFKILCEEESPDQGDFIVPNHYKIGKLNQHLSFSHKSVLDEAASVLTEDEYGLKPIHLAQSFLAGLGFSDDMQKKAPLKFSGGYQIRIQLVKLLLSEPDLLLLDEPTNYLDITSIRWLQRFLRQWNREFILVTHDRHFMSSVCNHTIGLYQKEFRKIKGTPADLYEMLAEEEELRLKTFESDQKKRAQTEQFINRFRAQANKAKQVQSRVKQLDKMESVNLAEKESSLGFSFNEFEFPGKRNLSAKNLTFKWNEETPICENFNIDIYHQDRIAIVGPNGKGKSTLLRLILNELPSQSGEVQFHDKTRIAYFGQTHVEQLNPENTIEQEIMECLSANEGLGKAKALAGLMMFSGDDATKPIKVLSGGERSRVLLAKILASPCNLLLLDEPTHHLDLESVQSLEVALNNFNGTIVLVSHDELLVEKIANRLIIFDGQEPFVYEGRYDEFLSQKGWSFEKTKEIAKTSSSKESRKDRAQKVQERSKLLRPIQKKLTSCESSIEKLEIEVEELNQKLLDASMNNEGAVIVEANTKLQETQNKLDLKYEELEELMLAQEEIEERYNL
jgi:ATP-binding cassette subfamily F protein 3